MNTTANKVRTVERPRGRPANLKSGELQSHILDIAENLFAEHGFAATPVRKLAQAAGVNPALVHYYFGSKQDLLIAVLDRALLPLAEGFSALSDSGSSKMEDIAKLVFNMAGNHPALPKLITREVLLSSGETRQLFAQNYAPKLGGALPGLISKEQNSGNISDRFDPGATALMLLSLCFFPFVARSLAEPMLGVQYSAAGREDYLRQVNTLLERGLTP